MLKIVSDLHLEYRLNPFTNNLINKIINPKYQQNKKMLALCGDIGNPYIGNYKLFLQNCSKNYEHVFLIPGNHEYYNLSKLDFSYKLNLISKEIKTISEINYDIDKICTNFNNIHFLNNKSIIIDGIKFCGSILWSHIPEKYIDYVQDKSLDTRLIYNDNGKYLSVEDRNILHSQCKIWIESELSGKQPTIILSHHSPLFNDPKNETNNVYDNKYHGKINNYLFSNDCGNLIRTPVKIWAFGHTHYNNKFNYNNVTIVTNQMGYKEENFSFDSENFIDLEYSAINNL
jgi:predicted phosphodiesterase